MVALKSLVPLPGPVGSVVLDALGLRVLRRASHRVALTLTRSRDSVQGVGNDESGRSGRPPQSGPDGRLSPHSPRRAPGLSATRLTLTSSQTSSLGFLRLILLGTLLVPVLAATGGAEIFTAEAGPATASTEPLIPLQAPPHVFMAILGVALISFAVASRVRKARI